MPLGITFFVTIQKQAVNRYVSISISAASRTAKANLKVVVQSILTQWLFTTAEFKRCIEEFRHARFPCHNILTKTRAQRGYLQIRSHAPTMLDIAYTVKLYYSSFTEGQMSCVGNLPGVMLSSVLCYHQSINRRRAQQVFELIYT